MTTNTSPPADTQPVSSDSTEYFGELHGRIFAGRPAVYGAVNATSPAAIDRLIANLQLAREWMVKADSDNAAIKAERDAARDRRPRR